MYRTCRTFLLVIILLGISLKTSGYNKSLANEGIEYRANLETCLHGYYPSLCRHNILTAEDKKFVKHAEYQANLKTCLQGYYPSLCRHNILTPKDKKRVKHAEYRATSFNQKLPKYSVNKKQNTVKSFNRCAENNSCYGDISVRTGRPKTTYVNGYYRRDGTYVRSHYRSRKK